MASRDITRGGDHATDNRNIGGSSLGQTARRLATETKQAFKTNRFWAMVALIVAILIAGNTIEGEEGGAELPPPPTRSGSTSPSSGSAYMVSRGLAKSGSRDPYYEDGTNQAHRDDADGSRR